MHALAQAPLACSWRRQPSPHSCDRRRLLELLPALPLPLPPGRLLGPRACAPRQRRTTADGPLRVDCRVAVFGAWYFPDASPSHTVRLPILPSSLPHIFPPPLATRQHVNPRVSQTAARTPAQHANARTSTARQRPPAQASSATGLARSADWTVDGLILYREPGTHALLKSIPPALTHRSLLTCPGLN